MEDIGSHGQNYEYEPGTSEEQLSRVMPGDVEDRIEEMQVPGHQWLNPEDGLVESVPDKYLDTAGNPIPGARWLARFDRSFPLEEEVEEDEE